MKTETQHTPEPGELQMFAVISDTGRKNEFATEREARGFSPKNAEGWSLLSPSGRALKIRRGRQQKVKLPDECEICGGLKGMMGVLENDPDMICGCDD